ncbi:charged multivesicular body protein 2b-like [Rhopilema esculentum]|uniref:charged multivesicular body protein 2b-like n=1 Tax=Rhopilema esculentum TaxID=499914 RepID=UPI0031D090BE|eukprot:gene17405-9005_t
MFSKKPNPKEQVKQQKRQLNKVQREMTRDRGALERQEKQLENEIKKAAKAGNKQLATTLAKQLVQLRKTKTRNLAASGKITAVGHQATAMHATHKMAGSMQTATKAMGAMNKHISPEELARTLQEFEKESAKMDMSEEMINDTLESVFDESGDEEEQDAVVSQVLDEIGIEISGKLAGAPMASKSLPKASKATSDEDKEIEDMLAKLKAT